MKNVFVLSCVVVLLCSLACLSSPASAQQTVDATATLNSPTANDVYYNDFNDIGDLVYQDTVSASGYVKVSSTGPANTEFSVDYNMFVKIDRDSVASNVTSRGIKSETYGPDGKWFKEATISGNWKDPSPDFMLDTNHVAEAVATITVYTTNSGSINKGSENRCTFVMRPNIW